MRLLIDDLHKSYPDLTVLAGLQLQLARGEAVAIQGSSGTGKSTLLNCVGLLDSPDSGQIELDGVAVTALSRRARSRLRGQRLGFVFQAFHLLPEFNVVENVLLAARCAGQPLAAYQHRAMDLLTRLGLRERAQADVRVLSGGERQRVALARALLLRPALILADEPTGNLDPSTAAMVLDQLLQLVGEESSSLILVTHDAQVAERCHRTLILRDGQLHPVPAPSPESELST